MKRHAHRSNFGLARQVDDQNATKALAPVRVTRDSSGHGALVMQLGPGTYPIPPRQVIADYVSVHVADDAVHIVFGKRDLFDPENAALSYALDISFPYSQFIRQLYRSVVTPVGPNAAPFRVIVEQAQQTRGYPRIENMPAARSATKQGTARANTGAMYVYDDEACIDFFHLDAFALHLASQGADEVNLQSVVRVVTTPNLLAYFIEQIVRAADEVNRRVPALAKEQAHV